MFLDFHFFMPFSVYFSNVKENNHLASIGNAWFQPLSPMTDRLYSQNGTEIDVSRSLAWQKQFSALRLARSFYLSGKYSLPCYAMRTRGCDVVMEN
jgi:hypothetical protein